MRKVLIGTLLALLASSFALGQTSNAETAKPTQSQLEAELLKAGRALGAAFAKQDVINNAMRPQADHRPKRRRAAALQGVNLYPVLPPAPAS